MEIAASAFTAAQRPAGLQPASRERRRHQLTRNLGELAGSGLLTRPPGAPDRNQPYALTPLGQGLMPIFKDLLIWGETLPKL
jgi:DNA-binding HxlR family transcriptional regulator